MREVDQEALQTLTTAMIKTIDLILNEKIQALENRLSKQKLTDANLSKGLITGFYVKDASVSVKKLTDFETEVLNILRSKGLIE